MSRDDKPDEIHSLKTIEDDGLIYEQMLREEAGVETKMDVYPGLSHDFWGVDTHLESRKSSGWPVWKERSGCCRWKGRGEVRLP